MLQDACQPTRRQCSNPAAVARALADYGDACRALGQHSKAAAALEEAQCLQIDNQLEGDRSEFALAHRAELETNPARALELLGETKAIQTRLCNVLGETRSTLLQARLLHNPSIRPKEWPTLQRRRQGAAARAFRARPWAITGLAGKTAACRRSHW